MREEDHISLKVHWWVFFSSSLPASSGHTFFAQGVEFLVAHALPSFRVIGQWNTPLNHHPSL